jgi:hypothetical protein
MDKEEVTLILILPIAGLIAGVAVLIAALRHRAKVLELVHKERVAMIERGIVPPELGPGGYDTQRLAHTAGTRSRSFSLGIIVMGLGFAFMTLIGIAAQAPNEAIGIGGAIAILGASFIVRSLVAAPHGTALPPAPTLQGPVSTPVAQPPAFPASDVPPSEPMNR